MNSFVPSRSRRRYRLAVESMEPRWFLSASTLAIDPDPGMLIEPAQQAILLYDSAFGDHLTLSPLLDMGSSNANAFHNIPALNQIDLSVVPAPSPSALVAMIDVSSFLNADSLLDFVHAHQDNATQVFYATSWNRSSEAGSEYYAFPRITRPSEDSDWIDIGNSDDPPPEPPKLVARENQYGDDSPDDLPSVAMMGSQGQSSLFQWSKLGSPSEADEPPQITSFAFETPTTVSEEPATIHTSSNVGEPARVDQLSAPTSTVGDQPTDRSSRSALLQDWLPDSRLGRLETRPTSSSSTETRTTAIPSASGLPSAPTASNDASSSKPQSMARRPFAADTGTSVTVSSETIAASWVPIGGLRLDVSNFQEGGDPSLPHPSTLVSDSASMVAMAGDHISPGSQSSVSEGTSRSVWVWQQLIGSTTTERLTRAIVVGMLLPILPRYRSENSRRTAKS